MQSMDHLIRYRHHSVHQMAPGFLQTRIPSSVAGQSTMANCFEENRVVQEESLMKIQQQPVRSELDYTTTKEEVRTAISKLKCHKAPGVDGIPAEV